MKKLTFLACLLAFAVEAECQLPSLGKAKGLLGSKPGGNSQTTQNSNNNSSSTSTTTSPAQPPSTQSKTGNKQGVAPEAASVIYFSNSSSVQAKQDTATNEFKDGDMVYLRTDFAKAMKDLGTQQYKYGFTLVIKSDGQYFDAVSLDYLKDSALHNNFFELQLVSSKSAAKYDVTRYITEAFAKTMTIGKHNFDVTITRADDNGNKMVVAEGTTVMDYTDGKKKLQDMAASFNPGMQIIKKDRMPQPVMRNAAIEKDLMNLISYDYTEPITPLKAVIDNSDWNIVRDEDNLILRRVISGYVAFKVPRNGRCFFKKIYIFQPYAGGGTYGKSKYYENGNTDLYEIEPANIMK